MAQITNSFPFQFYGTTIEVHMADDGHWYIRLDHMCEHLGLDSNSQRRKLQEHPAIGDRCIPIVINSPYRNSTRKQEVWFLDIHVMHLWLGMIQVLRVREELRERLIFYQRDLAQSLWLLYRSETLPKEILDEINASMSPNDRQVAEIFEAAQQLRRKVDILNGHLDEELNRLGMQHTGTSFLQMMLAYIWTAHGLIQVGVYNPPEQIVLIKYRNSTWISSWGELAALVHHEFRKDRYRFLGEPNFLGIVHAHFGEGESSFVSHSCIEYLVGRFPSASPVRDPLLSLMSRHIRVMDGGQSHYLINGFELLADLHERGSLFCFPVDLYEKMGEEQRLVCMANLLAFLGLRRPCFEQLRQYVEAPPKVGSWRDFNRAQPALSMWGMPSTCRSAI